MISMFHQQLLLPNSVLPPEIPNTIPSAAEQLHSLILLTNIWYLLEWLLFSHLFLFRHHFPALVHPWQLLHTAEKSASCFPWISTVQMRAGYTVQMNSPRIETQTYRCSTENKAVQKYIPSLRFMSKYAMHYKDFKWLRCSPLDFVVSEVRGRSSSWQGRYVRK